MKKQSIDSLFAQKLQQAEIAPRQEAWAKLERKMAKKEEKTVWLSYFRWSAAASVVLLAGLGIWFLNSSNKTVHGSEVAINEQKITIGSPKRPQNVKRKSIDTKNVLQITIESPKRPILYSKLVPNQKNGTSPKTQTNVSKPENVVHQSEVVVVKNEKMIVEPPIKKIEIVVPESLLQTIAAVEPVKKQEQTVRLELSEPLDAVTENIVISSKSELLSNLPKEKRINKIFRQLKNLKNGDDVDWQEVGVKSPKLLARLNNDK